jgi:endonuclease YncB( thermonuclease family)
VAVVVTLLSMAGPAAAQDRPDGIPGDTEPATVHRVVDGDKVYVRRSDGELDQVLLAGVDAPEPGECFFEESKDYLTDLLPKGQEIYLQQSGSVDRDGKFVVRYVWVPGTDGEKGYLVNTKLVRDGYAGFDDRRDTPRYFDRLDELERAAADDDRGLWGACTGLHGERREPTPTPMATPLAFEVVETEEVSFADRERWRYRIVVPDGEAASDDVVISTMRAALQQAFLDHPQASAVVVFAYLPGTDTQSVFTLARAVAAKHGVGWDGDGDLLGDPDNGQAAIRIVDWTGFSGDNERLYRVSVF